MASLPDRVHPAMKEKRTLCKLEEEGFIKDSLDDYIKLVRKGKFVCRRCGRVARKKRNLCKPEKLGA
jgi:hypothetical protein